MTSVLERSFPAPSHPTIFPPRKGTGKTDTGLQKAVGMFYADKHLFNLGFGLLPWTKLPLALQADRKKARSFFFEILLFSLLIFSFFFVIITTVY